jgi:flagellar hook-associated protein 1 FlgK
VDAPLPPNANLQQVVTITFTAAGSFDVSGTGTGNPAGVAYSAGANISLNGWTAQISGTPSAGDVFTISANTGGTGDNRNAVAMANLQTAAMLNSGNDTMQTAYAQVVSQVGNQAQEIKITSAAQDSLLGSVEQARQSVSGVNLDEEATNLLRYQQAYQASGKLIAIASTLFDTILRIG